MKATDSFVYVATECGTESHMVVEKQTFGTAVNNCSSVFTLRSLTRVLDLTQFMLHASKNSFTFRLANLAYR